MGSISRSTRMRARSQSGIQVTAGLVTLFKPSTDHGGVIYATLKHKYSPKRVCAHFFRLSQSVAHVAFSFKRNVFAFGLVESHLSGGI